MGQDGAKLIDRVSRQGEEALGRIAEELAASPMVGGAVARVLGAREKAVQAQEATMGMLNIPSAADVERLTRRLRMVSQRLEGIEDALDRIQDQARAAADSNKRGEPIEAKLDDLTRNVAELRQALAPAPRAAAKRKPRKKT